MKKKLPKMEYKTLEEQLIELYKSRKLKIVTIRVRALNNNGFEWAIIAKPVDEETDKIILKEISKK